MLTEKEMRTTLSVVEAQINSCPLTHCSDDTSDPLPLTPAEIIIGRPFQWVKLKSKDMEGSSLQKNLLHAWRNHQTLADSFWKQWSQDYVTQLVAYKKWAQVTPPLQVGDVVLVSDDHLPRLRWKLGHPQEIFLNQTPNQVKSYKGKNWNSKQKKSSLEMTKHHLCHLRSG